MIPSQLQNPEFRFALVPRGAKVPAERNWTTLNNYPFDAGKLKSWISRGGNYGVLCGYGNLAVVDGDNPRLSEIVEREIGQTFRVRSGSGRGFHDYLEVQGLEKKILLKREGSHMGDIQWLGQMIVGAESLHPSGGVYTIVRDIPVLILEAAKLTEAFKDLIRKPPITDYALRGAVSGKTSNLQSIPLATIISTFKGYASGKWVHGKTPGTVPKAGSVSASPRRTITGTAITADVAGGVASAIGLNEKIIQECPDTLSKNQFLAVHEIAKAKSGFRPENPN